MAEAEPTTTPRRRARGLLTSYYGGSDGADASASGDPLDDVNIDASNFNATKYVSSLLQYKSLEELVGRGNSMVSEIKSLDSDMQMLVYENYSKFISATDTIQQMKERVDGMAGSMRALEDNFTYVSRASDNVSTSFSARRGELERLNAVKRNLTKLQFLLDLPARLQRCVAAGEYSLAVRCHVRAARLMSRLGTVSAFHGIRGECELIMGRLSSTLAARLEEESVGPDELGVLTGLLLQLGSSEDALLQKYLARRRRAIAEAISGFAADSGDADDEDKPERAGEAEGEEGEEGEDGPGGGRREAGPPLPLCAEYTRQLGALVVPQLLQMITAWRELFCAQPADGEADGRPGALSPEKKEAMLIDALGELGASLVEACRRAMAAEASDSDDLLAGAAQLLEAVAPLHEALPEAKVVPCATRACEGLAKRAIEDRMAALREELSGAVGNLVGEGDGAAGALPDSELRGAGEQIAAAVGAAVEAVTPLLAPMCELLRLRADGVAVHLTDQLHAAVVAVLDAASQPQTEPRAVLRSAGVCLQMAAGGAALVPDTLRRALAPQGLGGAALGLDAAGLSQQFRRAADALLRRFVEMQAQAVSVGVSHRMHAFDWLHCAPPCGVTSLVGQVLGELRAMQRLAAGLFPTEPTKPMLPTGPFPPITPLEQQLAQKLAASSAGGGTASIHKDLQRMFARKVSFETAGFVGTGGKAGAEPSLGAMVAHVAKLTLKTLVEEVRCATFSRHGFQQVQVDMAMLRWVLPSATNDPEPLVSLLDEAFISCQERSLECVPLEHSVVEAFCENERRQLLAAIH